MSIKKLISFILFLLTGLWSVWSVVILIGFFDRLFFFYALMTWVFNALVGLFFLLRYFKRKL